jgi:glycerophosphoryl diester phosphodiesterase
VQSFDDAVLWTAFAHRPEVRLEFLVDDARKPIPAGPWRAVNADFKSLAADVVRRLRDANYAVGAWTVNEDVDIRRIIGLGVERLITDRPLRARDFCPRIG